MRAMLARASSDSAMARIGRCRFMPHSLRSAAKPECISAEIERAWARLAVLCGHSFFCGNFSARYSRIESESQIVISPSIKAGTLPESVTLQRDGADRTVQVH